MNKLVLAATILLCIHSAHCKDPDPIRIAVIDTVLDFRDPRFRGFLCHDGHADFTGTGIEDTHGHGTHVAGLIRMRAGHTGYCLMILKYLAGGDDDSTPGAVRLARSIAAMNWATKHGADIMNISSGGPEFSPDEYMAARIAYVSGVLIVASAGNEKDDLRKEDRRYFPASYRVPNIIMVGSMIQPSDCKIKEPDILKLDLRNRRSYCRAASSSWGDPKMIYAVGEHVVSYGRLSTCSKDQVLNGYCTREMSGTSMATPIVTGAIVFRYLNRTSQGILPSVPASCGKPGKLCPQTPAEPSRR